jgi:hypothetical protein
MPILDEALSSSAAFTLRHSVGHHHFVHPGSPFLPVSWQQSRCFGQVATGAMRVSLLIPASMAALLPLAVADFKEKSIQSPLGAIVVPNLSADFLALRLIGNPINICVTPGFPFITQQPLRTAALHQLESRGDRSVPDT